MLQQYHTKLKGTLALTDSYLTEKALQKEKGLYKFIWVRNGSITVEIDHQEMILTQDEVISLTHLQHLEFKSIDLPFSPVGVSYPFSILRINPSQFASRQAASISASVASGRA